MSEQKHSPGPWFTCRDSRCTCGQVWSETADHPVATVTRGAWGDTYPALRATEDSTELGQKIEPYVEMIEYGSVGEDTALANARLIASAPDLLAALAGIVEYCDDFTGKSKGESLVVGMIRLLPAARAAIAKASGAQP